MGILGSRPMMAIQREKHTGNLKRHIKRHQIWYTEQRHIFMSIKAAYDQTFGIQEYKFDKDSKNVEFSFLASNSRQRLPKRKIFESVFNNYMAKRYKCSAKSQTKQHKISDVPAGKSLLDNFPRLHQNTCSCLSWCQNYHLMDKEIQ
jgi:hypothetical protein